MSGRGSRRLRRRAGGRLQRGALHAGGTSPQTAGCDRLPHRGRAMMLQGLTSAYLLRKTTTGQAGDAVLIHAAAGGVGLIACQWAKALGATVIGTTSSEEKAALARAHGADHHLLQP